MRLWLFKDKVRLVLCLTILAFVLRLIFIGVFVGVETPPGIGIKGFSRMRIDLFSTSPHDARDYDRLAWNLSSGRGFSMDGVTPSSSRAPGFPLFLAAIYSAFGHNYFIARIFQSLVGSATVVLVYLIGKEAFSERTGILAAVLWSLYPIAAVYSGFLLSENLFTFLLASGVFCLFRILKENSWKNRMICGLLIGFATLVRPTTIVLPPFIFIWAWLNKKWSKEEAMKTAATICFFMAAVILPWSIRNLVAQNHFIPIASTGGIAFLGSNNEMNIREHRGTWVSPSEIPGYGEKFQGLSEVEVDVRAYELGIAFLKKNPRQIPKLIFWKFIRFWDIGSSKTSVVMAISFFSYGLLFTLFVYGLFLSLRDYSKNSIFFLLTAQFILVSLIFYGSYRLRYPLEPYIFILAVFGFQNLINKTRVSFWPFNWINDRNENILERTSEVFVEN